MMRILFNILVKYRQHFFTDLVSIELFRRPVFRYPQQTIASVARSTHRYKARFLLGEFVRATRSENKWEVGGKRSYFLLFCLFA